MALAISQAPPKPTRRQPLSFEINLCQETYPETQQPELFLEQILECRARIHRPRRTRRRRFLFHPNPHGIERTLIALVLTRHSLSDRLRAFEPARSVEIGTLPAGVQFEAALRTLPDRLGYRCQQSAALRAARNRVRARHLQCARSKGLFLDRLFAGLLLPLFFFAAILISVLAILPVGHEQPPVQADIVSLRQDLHKSVANSTLPVWARRPTPVRAHVRFTRS
jgi:hypothetical protein